MRRKLRTGFTTGTAAAAATKGALKLILDRRRPARVRIRLLIGDDITIPVHSCRSSGKGTAICTVIKDAGDDPDVTHKAEIGARVSIKDYRKGQKGSKTPKITIHGGEGVGRVTKPGLEVAPGGPAINPGPVKMITQAIHDVLDKHARVGRVATEIFVPAGEKLAKKTLNAKLGIIGGISILGTTGIVRPMSHDAFAATIRLALSVARAAGLDHVVLTTGRRSERFSQLLWPAMAEEAFIQIGDFFKMSLAAASDLGFESLTLAVFFGKALKMAQGVPHTHASKASLTLNRLATWTQDMSGNRELAQRISAANTARHAFDIIGPDRSEIIAYVGQQIVKSAQRFAGKGLRIQSIIFDYKGNVVFDSDRHANQTG